MVDTNYTNGVIAVKEKLLLGEKLLRYCEMSAEEVLRALSESGFGSGAAAQEGEALCEAEERVLDAFIREYGPKTERVYLLSPRDFHNAKALCKAKKLGTVAQKLLAPEGMVPIQKLEAAIDSGEAEALGAELGGAVKAVLEDETLGGAEIGAIFEQALYRHLSAACKWRGVLKSLLAARADRVNILTALRAADAEQAEKLYVGGGKLTAKQLAGIFEPDWEKRAHALDKTDQKAFYAGCLAAKDKGLPFTEAERELESCDAEYFRARRYELEGKEPFLYYVFRRRAEIANVRILLVCLNAGLSAQDIRKRLRAI